MKVGEIRYFQWGDEGHGKVSTWTISEDGYVKMLGKIDIEEAIAKKLIYKCPYS